MGQGANSGQFLGFCSICDLIFWEFFEVTFCIFVT